MIDMNRWQRAVVLIGILFALAACGGQRSGTQPVDETVTVKRGTLSVAVSGSGTVQPARTANMAFSLGGTVQAVSVAEGQFVEAGQELARLDARELEANVAAAQAQVDQAQARLEQLEQSEVAPETDINIAEAALRQAEAQRTIAELNRDKAVLRAPFDGLVATLNLQPGDTAAPAAANNVPLQLLDVSAFHIDATINETDIALIEEGQSTNIFIDALGTEPLAGTVADIAPAAAVVQNIAAYPVRIEFERAPTDVRAGMSASIDIQVAEEKDTLVVPNSAIRNENGRSIVRLQQGDRFVDTEVQTGLSNDTETQITAGLSEGDVVAAIGIAATDSGGAQ